MDAGGDGEKAARQTGLCSIEVGARHLDADAGLAPMSPLGVVSVAPSAVVLAPADAGCSQDRIADRRDRRVDGLCGREEGVPDGVTSAETDPLWDRSVLLLGLGQLDLRAERLVALCGERLVSYLFHIILGREIEKYPSPLRSSSQFQATSRSASSSPRRN